MLLAININNTETKVGLFQGDSLEALKKAVTVTTLPAVEIQKMKDVALKGVWQKMRSDPGKGPILKLLEEDVANFNKK